MKCFRDTELIFAAEGSNEVRRWTALLGQNGLGKSTLLQAMAVPLAGPGAIRELLPVAEGWVREGEGYGEIEAHVLFHEGDAQLPRWPKKTPYTAHYLVTGTNPDLLPAGIEDVTVPSIVSWAGGSTGKKRETLTKDFSRLKQTAYAEGKNGWLACGYGPFRRLTGGSQDADRILYSGRRSARFVTLFREDAALTNATQWLVGLHNQSREGEGRAQRSLDAVRQAFASGFFMENVELVLSALDAKLVLGSRRPIAFNNLSDGYRSMLALGIDLLRWIVEAFPTTENPLLERGVVLIDELDAHLHPDWQQRIGTWLLEKFPNLQFIVATHSPFLAQVSPPGGNIVLSSAPDGVNVRSEPQSVSDWRAEQVLTELFGLSSTRSPSAEEALRRLRQLQEKIRRGRKIEPTETAEYEQLQMRFGADYHDRDENYESIMVSLERAVASKQKELRKTLK